VLWITFNEGRDTLYKTWKSFGWRPEEALVYDFPFVPQYRETLFNQVVDLAYKEKAKVFVIDGVEAIVFDRVSATAAGLSV
jgi:KaiC/GvpD/RAD55 family RecA-like ATPase